MLFLNCNAKYGNMGHYAEFYYLLPNEDDNEIANTKYQDRIQYLKQKTLQKYIDIYTHPKFKDSHLIYEAQGKQFIWRN